jgi:hypothetical protein
MNYRLRQLALGSYDFVLGHHGGQRHPQPYSLDSAFFSLMHHPIDNQAQLPCSWQLRH